MGLSQSTAESRTVSHRTAVLLLVMVTLFWGANWPVTTFGLRYIPPLSLAAARVALGATVLFLFNAATGNLHLPRRNDWPIVLGVGLLQMTGYLALVTIALQVVPPGRSAILAYTTSLWVVPGAVLLLGERLSPLKLTGFLLGLVGVGVMFNPLGFNWSEPHVLVGNGLLLLAALLWATLILQIRHHRWEASPLELAPWQLSVAAVILLPLAVVLDHGHSIDWSRSLDLVLAYNGLVATAFSFWAITTVSRALPAITTSLGTLGVPVASVVFAAIFLGERITLTNMLGLAFIAGGLASVSMADRRELQDAR